jgi:hypothetical protein
MDININVSAYLHAYLDHLLNGALRELKSVKKILSMDININVSKINFENIFC